MIRSSRRVVRVFALLSLAAAVGVAALGVRSTFVDDHLGRYTAIVRPDGRLQETRTGLFSSGGLLTWCDGREAFISPTPAPPAAAVTPAAGKLVVASAAAGDFGWWHGERDGDFFFGFGTNGPVRAAPHAYFVVLLLILPVYRRLARPDRIDCRALALAYVVWIAYGWFSIREMYVYALPVLFLGGIGFVMISVLATHRANRLRRSAGLCTACGYDLRASPDRCPECGTAVTARQDASNADPSSRSDGRL